MELMWWTYPTQHIPQTHQQHQVACNDQMTTGTTAMLWLVQAQETISLRVWTAGFHYTKARLTKQRVDQVKCSPNVSKMSRKAVHLFCSHSIHQWRCDAQFHLCDLGKAWPIADGLYSDPLGLLMWLFKQQDDGQGAARCPLKTFRAAPKLPWVSSFQRVPKSLIL